MYLKECGFLSFVRDLPEANYWMLLLKLLNYLTVSKGVTKNQKMD